MNSQPVITAGALAGLFLAGWDIVVKQGLLEFLRPEAADSVSIFVNLLVPIVAAVIAARFVTTLARPNLPIGTRVNVDSTEPTAIVVQDRP